MKTITQLPSRTANAFTRFLVPISLLAALGQAQDAEEAPAEPAPALSEEDGKALLKRIQKLELEVQQMEYESNEESSGEHTFLVTGFASTSFINMKGSDSTFKTTFNPIILYKYGDNFLFESELEFDLGFGAQGGETDVGLGYANGSYIVNDNLIVGVGKFLTPFGIFSERIHPSWINKLPTSPLMAGHGGLVPMSSIGAFARGGVRTGSVKWNYSFYVSNGPRLNTGVDGEDEAGLLHFDNNVDTNNAKSVGARIGCLPIPQLELGVSYLTGGVTPSGSEVTDATSNLLGVDVSYNPRMAPSSGRIELRGEWVMSDIDNVTYDPSGTGGYGPLTYDNQRNGGYMQAAYRLPGSDLQLSAWECVGRYDMLQQPDESPQAGDQDRMTVGINHWLSPSSVIKAAYQWDDKQGSTTDMDAFYLQFAVGF